MKMMVSRGIGVLEESLGCDLQIINERGSQFASNGLICYLLVSIDTL